MINIKAKKLIFIINIIKSSWANINFKTKQKNQKITYLRK